MKVCTAIFQIDEKPNISLNQMISQLPLVNNAFVSVNINPFPLTSLNLELFVTNYFLYCGTVGRGSKPYLIAWLIYPKTIAISHAQVAKFRDLKAPNGDLINSNCHEMQNIINPNGVFFLDQVIDQEHRRESSLFCLPSLRHISKIPSLKMSEQNLHKHDLERGTHKTDATNTEFLQRVTEPSYMNSFQQKLKIQPQNYGEITATLGSTNQNEVETALKYQKKWNVNRCQDDDVGKAKVTHLQSRLKNEEENGNELDSTDYESETSIGDAIGSTTVRLSSKQERTATSYHQNGIHDARERINVVDIQHSDISLQETRGSTMKRIDSDTQQYRT
ncbi:hypothetical protein J437_LFUL012799 [Ladona fulva]|uniref:Alpha-carbonic anhydrase domain-containing protein n=1 Tax=Ladona fulva TaxID=123851 RepID=A0A8K0KLJ1_LADFU|nr:hypothetical protein J437_LFUL012799 [Ladona fulva]